MKNQWISFIKAADKKINKIKNSFLEKNIYNIFFLTYCRCIVVVSTEEEGVDFRFDGGGGGGRFRGPEGSCCSISSSESSIIVAWLIRNVGSRSVPSKNYTSYTCRKEIRYFLFYKNGREKKLI